MVYFFSLLFYLITACATQQLSPPDIKPPVYGDLYKPDSSGQFPALVLLHGRSGIFQRYHDEAMFLSKNGYVTLVLDYYQGIGSYYVLGEEKRLKRWHAHQQAVFNAVNYLKTLAEVEKDHLGLIGYSQGAMLALSVAGDIPEANAIVDYYGVSPAQKDFVNYA